MARLVRISRLSIGALALGAAAPMLALEWGELAGERDVLAEEVQRLQEELARVQVSGHSASQTADVDLGYAGTPLPFATPTVVATETERRVQLATEAAALRRELAAARAERSSWDRREGTLDLVVDPEARPQGSSLDDTLIDFSGRTEQLQRRLKRADRDLDEVQVDRDEALAQLRREMFSNLLHSAVIGECGHRNTRRTFDSCADRTRDRLRPEWDRFEACVRDYNAVPAYSQSASAQNVSNAHRLERGAVLMCDPGLPEGGNKP